MTYNQEEFPRYVRTAGKITIFTALAGLMVFLFAFVFDVGKQELSRVSAQTASTTLTVLNTPPAFTVYPYEVIGSATTTPTNSGTVQQWGATAVDANAADYWLIVCSTSAAPTANNEAPPTCDPGAITWGVSATTTSGVAATVSTTTLEWGTGQFSAVNNWYAWVCDADGVDPRCSVTPEQGDYATSSSPFHINNRPVLSGLWNNGPKDPGQNVTFFSTSTDLDTVGGDQDIKLVVCGTNTDYNATTNTCNNYFIASTTISQKSNATATKTLAAILRDDTYGAYGFIVDQYGHEASANPLNSDFDVNNVAPTVLGGDIEIYGVGGPASNLTLTIPGGETPSSTLNFTLRDANSCLNAASSSEFAVVPYKISVFRSGVGTTTCNGNAGSYNPNNCYPSGVGSSVWDLSCTATTTCNSPLQDYMDYTCEFPLWFIADPTDNGVNTPAALEVQNWSAGVAGIDEALTGAMSTTSNPVDLTSFSAIGIVDNAIAYGGVEPGDDTGTLSATSTAQNIGNTGLDQDVRGESMCGTFTVSNECPSYATSTVPEWKQQFSTSTYAYDTDATEAGALLDPRIVQLSSTTYKELELNVQKTTSTSSALWKQGTTYWGIAVPSSITLAGSYQGLNTFMAKTAEAPDWNWTP